MGHWQWHHHGVVENREHVGGTGHPLAARGVSLMAGCKQESLPGKLHVEECSIPACAIFHDLSIGGLASFAQHNIP